MQTRRHDPPPVMWRGAVAGQRQARILEASQVKRGPTARVAHPVAPPAQPKFGSASAGTVQMWSLSGVLGNLTGAITTAAIGALIASVASIAAGITAGTAAALYLALKSYGFGPYIGGQNNLQLLSAGKHSQHSLGIGLVNKGHFVGHSVVTVDGVAVEQTVGNVPEGIKGTLRPLVSGVDTNTNFGPWEDFDPDRGRLCIINIPMNNAASASTLLNRKHFRSEDQGTLGKYHYFNNSCTSHVADICQAAGLDPPGWACSPTLIWLWAKLMAAIQNYFF